ncbi:hypothetical protein FRB98_007851 [Tulasnella sp. 332]|nr:hypothetical protein FRB98_007851 [Tulasnella sp. 332]
MPSDQANSPNQHQSRPFVPPPRHLSRPVHKRTIHPIRKHKRFPSAFSTDTLSTLPEYQALEQSHNHLAPRAVQTQIDDASWDGDEMPPPPGYPGTVSSTGGEMSAEEADEERELVRLPMRSRGGRKPSRRRSFGADTEDDRLDSLLERSILALEASNALMQSSLATQSSLANVLADSSFDRSMDAQIQFLCRRYASDGEREAGLDQVLTGVSGLIGEHTLWEHGNGLAETILEEQQDDGMTRSLPAENHMYTALARSSIPFSSNSQLRASHSQRRLRLSADGTRPRSPPPRPFTQYVSIESENGLAAEATPTGDVIYLPSTSGVRTSPKRTTFLSISSPPSTPLLNIDKPEQQTTPTKTPLAHAMLTRIASGSTNSSRAGSPEAIRSLFTHLPRASKQLFSSQDAALEVGEERGRGAQIGVRGVLESQATSSRPTHRAQAASMSSVSSLAQQKNDESLVPLSTEVDEVGKTPPIAFAITASLRKILADSGEKRAAAATVVSEVAAGKQRADGERPETTSPSRRSRSASVGHAHLRPAVLGAISSPSASQAIVYRGEKSASDRILEPPTPFLVEAPTPPTTSDSGSAGPSNPPDTPRSSISGNLTPRRSAMKGGSSHTTPISSGQNSPFRVSFSPLPPKHETDGTFSRAKGKGKVKGKSKAKEESEKKGWWSDWLLGTAPGDTKNPFTPVHSRTGSTMREEGRRWIMQPETKPQKRVVGALIWRGAQLLVQQRPATAKLPLLWEFPGGKTEEGESDVVALRRECLEELAVEVVVGSLAWKVDHEYDHLSVSLALYHATLASAEAEPQPLAAAELKWATPAQLPDLPFLPADVEVVNALAKGEVRGQS